MTYVKPRKWVAATSLVALMTGFAACATSEPTPEESTGKTSSAQFTNGGFETGLPGSSPANWTIASAINPATGVTIQTPQTRTGLNLGAGGTNLTTEVAGAGAADPDLGVAASLRYCRYGAQCARVNFHSSTTFGHGQNVNSMSQTMTIGVGDVDPTDSLVHVRFAVAPVLQNPGHAAALQPYYFVQLTNITQANRILYTDFNLSAQAGVPWKTINGGTANEIDYVDWSLVDISGAGNFAMGDMVKLEVIASGCAPGGHFGEIYVDGVGATIPGIFVSGSGPANANGGTDIVYALKYKNGAAIPETGVVIDFTTPPGTTFKSIVPPAGATCTTPAVGMTGTIVCTFSGPVPAGAAGAFSITVTVDPNASGIITAGTYDIHSTQETPLTGNKIYTQVGCLNDTQCTVGTTWCKESTPSSCQPKLANGVAIPTDVGHTNPVLNGMCTGGAGTLVCTSSVCDTDNKCGYLNNSGPCTVANGGTLCRAGVCDTDGRCGLANGDGICTAQNGGTLCRSGICDTDSKCGLANGDGACTVANGGTLCRSGVCDPDLHCGLANGDGTCTVANGPVLCRSGACSTNGKCEPSGGCNVDADCTGGKWCLESTHTCTAKLPNDTAIPTDATHTNPALTGMCAADAAMLVCASGVCDTHDNKCGFAPGDGPCTTGNGAVVCRSGLCSSGGVCLPPGACNVDSDCMGGQWCEESAHVCTAKIANGGAMPTDGPHMNPTLDGTCSAAAAMLVCASGVCDTHDSKCGYANGDGPCTMANGAMVCRSAICDSNGTCVATNPTDGGVVDSGAVDSGAVDSGGAGDGGSAADASAANDAGVVTSDGSDVIDEGTIEGAGFDCAVAAPGSGTKGGTSGMAAGGALFGLALVVSRRRRRTATEKTGFGGDASR